MVATAYMEEAERFDWLAAMDDGHVIATGTPAEVRRAPGAETLEARSSLCSGGETDGHKARRFPLVCRSQGRPPSRPKGSPSGLATSPPSIT